MASGFSAAFNAKLIYIFRINDAAHQGCLKIGETSLQSSNLNALPPNCPELNAAAHQRIAQYTQPAAIAYDLLYTEVAQRMVSTSDARRNFSYQVLPFSDHDVHQVLLRSGIKRKDFDLKHKANEWFECDLNTAIQAITAVKEGRSSLNATTTNAAPAPIIFRPEQQEAIAKTTKKFQSKNGKRMLWNAKMRFGKTLCALQVVKELDLRRTIIITHRPVVNESWFDDFHKIFADSPQFAYSSKDKGECLARLEQHAAQAEALEALSKEPSTANPQKGTRDRAATTAPAPDHYVYFASLQDLRGSDQVGGNFDKNKEVFAINWDLIIIDEAHEGTQTKLGTAVTQALTKENTKLLSLSGTPFNLLPDFKQDEIYTWDYVMEQQAKAEWDLIHQGDPNPYAGLPRLNLYTYNLGKLFAQYASSEFAFNFTEFFRVDAKSERFSHEADVKSFLNLLTKQSESNYPFANERFRAIFRHTLWVVPGVKAAQALSALLKAHPVFSHFAIVNVAGAGDYNENDTTNASTLGATEALTAVTDAIGPEPDQTSTITISCGRLTTGVSVREWTGVLMLAGSYQSSASSYLQTIFRVQTPATIAGKVKEQCYAFDFAPDRALKVIAATVGLSKRSGATQSEEENARAALKAFLNFCPVIAIDGSSMQDVDIAQVMEQVKRVYIEQVVTNGFDDVHLYNDQLLKLNDLDLTKFQQLQGIIGQTKSIGTKGKVTLNQQGLTDEEHEELEQLKKKKNKELTAEELARRKELQEKAKVRDDAIAILRGISIRMPLMIYGATINDEDRELTIENFAHLVDDVSWDEFMPQGVTKEVFSQFIQYYDPDVFTAAGKRIRALARAADDLRVDERIKLISSIFAHFRNPDKETVLTPWRVVNMHLSATIGGYCFYNEDFSQELTEPRLVNHAPITDRVFLPKAKLLEINSKSGLYPLYLTYTLLRLYLDTYDNRLNLLTTAQQQQIWDKVLQQNIFVICKSPMARSITERTLVGFRKVQLNICYIDQLLEQLTSDASALKHIIESNSASLWPASGYAVMKFDAIVGNPPYQTSSNDDRSTSRDMPVYHYLVNACKELDARYISLIIPSRWMATGLGLNEFRHSMLSDHHLRKLVDFPVTTEVFSNVEIKGGVCLFLRDRDYEGPCEFISCRNNEYSKGVWRNLDEFDILVRNSTAAEILRKVLARKEPSMMKLLSVDKEFGWTSNFQGFYQERHNTDDVPLYYNRSGKRLVGYIDRSEITKSTHLINTWKVMVPEASSDGGQKIPDSVLGSTFIAPCPSVCTQTYLFFYCASEAEAHRIQSYIKTRFFRFMVSLRKLTQHAPRGSYIWVPQQDFSEQSQFDWDSSTAELEQALYDKYQLSTEERAYIERMVKVQS
ncbi:MAG TPA: Eco57I restriction-modification methylase domain-containing protein [Candidatus Anaerobiospirillum stercoravium]|nr:Eco57I restriction-modification methylase domain-containing protein [Candidatus Anaerobiospirillum stercoravium]